MRAATDLIASGRPLQIVLFSQFLTSSPHPLGWKRQAWRKTAHSRDKAKIFLKLFQLAANDAA
jgi:hypothetical protein